MNAILYKAWVFSLLIYLFSSCQDEKEAIPEISEEEDREQFLNIERHDNLRQLVENLTYADPAPGESQRAVMRYGIRLDMTVPTVYTTGVEDFEEAEEIFRSSLVPMGLDSLYTQEGSCLMDFGEYGNASFQRNKSGGALLATLDLSLDSIPHITQLRFVRKDALPENNGVKTFTRGQIVADASDNGRKYICVSSITQGNPCRLICFYRTKDEMVYKHDGTTQVFTNCIDEHMAKSLRAFINEATPLWEKSERVYFLKYNLKRCQYSRKGVTLSWSSGNKPPFSNKTQDLKWILNTNMQRKSKGAWFWKETWYNYTFRWYDCSMGTIKTTSHETKPGTTTSYDMPEAIAMSGVALDVIDENRWKLVDNITPANYKNYPEH